MLASGARRRKREGGASPGLHPKPIRREVVAGRGSPTHRDWTTKEEGGEGGGRKGKKSKRLF